MGNFFSFLNSYLFILIMILSRHYLVCLFNIQFCFKETGSNSNYLNTAKKWPTFNISIFCFFMFFFPWRLSWEGCQEDVSSPKGTIFKKFNKNGLGKHLSLDQSWGHVDLCAKVKICHWVTVSINPNVRLIQLKDNFR